MSEHTTENAQRFHEDGSRRRLAECARRNPENDEYAGACCRFPKSCSPYPYDETPVTEADLEPRRSSTIRVPQATALTIKGPDGSTLLTIHRDGRWEFRDEAAPTEAARVFVREVGRLAGVADRLLDEDVVAAGAVAFLRDCQGSTTPLDVSRAILAAAQSEMSQPPGQAAPS